LTRFKKILEWSSVPGTSRHHWGTDIDINNTNILYFQEEKGTREYIWLVQNAPTFGFCQPYNFKNGFRTTGYNEERWHWSYLPIARELTQKYKNSIKEEDINGFLGEKFVPGQNLIDDYVLGINPDCL
jgi:LAS superfamily LD-carboxypeptidase LdcB